MIACTIHQHFALAFLPAGLVVAEILRRFLWNFFRVEYAHVLSEK